MVYTSNTPMLRNETYYFVEINPFTLNILPESIFVLDVVSDLDFSSPNAIVTYETVGGDGGYSISTGRLTQTVTLSVVFASNVPYGNSRFGINLDNISPNRDALLENVRKLEILKRKKNPVYIYRAQSFTSGNFFGRYLIKNISGGIREARKAIPIRIELVEYKTLNVRKSIIVGGPTSKFAEADVVGAYLKARNLLVKQ